jgi:hypothetical protein
VRVGTLLAGLVYLAVITPVGLALRLGRDPLRLRRPAGRTFWRARPPAHDDLAAARNQY